MSRPVSYPPDAKSAARALRLDAALAAAGIDLAELGPRIGLKTSAARTLWRQGVSPQENRWRDAAAVLGVDADWLITGVGHAPRRVADRLAWRLANPDLPPHLHGNINFSRVIAGSELSETMPGYDEAKPTVPITAH